MWKLFLGEIPLLAAALITMIVCGCFSNTFALYALLSILKICIYHEFGWFMRIEQKLLTKIVVIFTFICFLTVDGIRNYTNFTESKYFGFTIFLAFSTKCGQKQVILDVSRYPAAVIFCLISFLIECYISVKIKRIPFTSLKTGTIGQIIMASTLIIASTNFEAIALYGIKVTTTFFVFQVLYLLKYRDYACHMIKTLCPYNRNTVEPESYQISLNDFGIFVGNSTDIPSTVQNNLNQI